MLLKKLEIYGFKSFADRIYFKFDKGITAIVGPNGSGKSNIADAIRWVLGEQSSKSLRSNKMDDIIFAGTEVRRSIGFAEVSLTLDNFLGDLPIEYAEVTISRKLYRSGDSEYYINKNACRLKDITELFMDTGVGKEGYSIIGQGRIDEILSNRPDERRYIFEEAAGIVKYKTQRDESERKLAKTRDNLLRAEDIILELEKQLTPLQKQSEVAKTYLELRDELRKYEINLFLHQYSKNIEQMNKLSEQINLLDEDIKNHKMVLKEKENEKAALNDAILKVKQSIDSYSKERFDAITNIEKYKGDLNLKYEKINQSKKENNRLTNEINDEHKETEKKKNEIKQLQVLVDKNNNEINIIKDKESEAKIGLTNLENEINDYQAEIDKTRNNMMDILNKVSDCKNQITRYQTINDNLKSRLEKVIEVLDKKDEDIKNIQNEKSSLQNSIILTEKDIPNKKKEIEIVKAKIDSLVKCLDDINEAIQKNMRYLEGRKSRLNLLEDMEDNYEGFNKGIKQILIVCESSKSFSNKVCGAVASLLSVNKEYELAIETALGASLQNIVTESEEDAKYLINFLKEHKYGRATFLPITSIRRRYLGDNDIKVLEMDGCCGVASELIQYNLKYKEIFEYLLGRVIIAEDLDCAIKMGQRFRYSFKIVTLQGDVVNAGGSMTGGSRANKGSSLLGRNREISELRSEIDSIESSLKNLDKDKEKKNNILVNNRQVENALLDSLRKIEQKSTDNEDQLNRLLEQKEQVEKEINSYKNEKQNIDQSIIDVSLKLKELEIELKNLDEQSTGINEFTQESEEFLNEKLKKKEEISSHITEIRIDFASKQKEISNLDNSLNRLKSEVDKSSKDIAIKNVEINVIKNEIAGLNESIKEVQDKIQATADTVKKLEMSIKDEEKINAEKELMLLGINNDYSKINDTVSEIVDKRHKFDVQSSRIEVELENYQKNIWDDYQITYSTALSYRDESLNMRTLNQKTNNLKKQISSLGNVNVNSIEEYKKVSERYTFLTKQRDDLLAAKDDLKQIIEDVTKTMEVKFKEEFEAISQHFGETFRKLFNGGQAKLILEDPGNALTCGIKIIAQPPGKKLQSLSLLSGGEKALTAIAILFAILKHKPTPFCVLDEIDAALDESNLNQFSACVKEFSAETQFCIITHRKTTMGVSNAIYGIAMEEKGVSKIVSVKFDEEKVG